MITDAGEIFASELVKVIGAVLGRPLRYQEAPPDVVRQRFIGLGFPADFSDAYVAMLAETLEKPALVTRETENILGRPALTFGHWVSQHRAVFTEQIGA